MSRLDEIREASKGYKPHNPNDQSWHRDVRFLLRVIALQEKRIEALKSSSRVVSNPTTREVAKE